MTVSEMITGSLRVLTGPHIAVASLHSFHEVLRRSQMLDDAGLEVGIKTQVCFLIKRGRRRRRGAGTGRWEL